MSVLIVIPARYASTRYPAKPLALLTGASGTARSLIERSWRAACEVQGVDKVVVATDDDRIKDAAEAFGAEVVMTSVDCANGTERCAEARANTSRITVAPASGRAIATNVSTEPKPSGPRRSTSAAAKEPSA